MSLSFPSLCTFLLLIAKDRCCPLNTVTNVSICEHAWNTTTHDDANHQCAPGYQGLLCAACTFDHVQIGSVCVGCSGTAELVNVLLVLVACCFVFFSIVLLLLVCCIKNIHGENESDETKEEKEEKKEEKKGEPNETSNDDPSNSKEKATNEEKDMQTGTAAVNSAPKTAATRSTSSGCKILLTFGQILSSMPVAFSGVPWPKEFLTFVFVLGFPFNLDFLKAFAIGGECVVCWFAPLFFLVRVANVLFTL